MGVVWGVVSVWGGGMRLEWWCLPLSAWKGDANRRAFEAGEVSGVADGRRQQDVDRPEFIGASKRDFQVGFVLAGGLFVEYVTLSRGGLKHSLKKKLSENRNWRRCLGETGLSANGSGGPRSSLTIWAPPKS